MIPPPNVNFANSNDYLSCEIFDMERMRTLPPGTCGRALANFIDRHGLAVVTTRGKLVHDFVHVLTGYDTTPVGETEVLAFFLGAQSGVESVVSSGIGVLRAIQQSWKLGFLQSVYASGEPLGSIAERAWRAYQRGRASGFDAAAVKPEQFWEWPLNQVQALYPGLA